MKKTALLVIWIVLWGVFSLPTRFTTHPRLRRLDVFRLAKHPDQLLTKRRALDAGLNLVFYIPGGVLVGASMSSPAAAAISMAAFSGVAEGSQLFSRGRFPAVSDFVLNTTGGVLGVWLARKRRRAPGGQRPVSAWGA